MMKFLFVEILLFFLSVTTFATEEGRFFYHGNGKLKISNASKLRGLSPRLIALIDYLQEQLSYGKGTVKILSGYRSPQYNENLRKQGRLAGKASLHLEGMAADFVMEGVSAKKMWEYARQLNCCGVGFYHGNAIHLDTGPPRFWDETTSKVYTDISTHNKQIYAVTRYDIYHPGENLTFQIVRATEYPFGIKNEVRIMNDGNEWKKVNLENKEDCIVVHNREEAQQFTIPILQLLDGGAQQLSIQISFCNKPSDEMPDQILSNPFVIVTQE
ncbi:MAG: DUF882 domain-containing protein [Deltaproteobacteria bacterium]|nr:DUF882 domain-containing protein [Deltaproteobacteria bacterium]